MSKSRYLVQHQTNYKLTSLDEQRNQNLHKANRDVREFKFCLDARKSDLILRHRVAYFLLGLFALNTIGALTIVFLVGFRLMVISNIVIVSLIGETIAYATAMFFTVTKYLFPTK